LENLNDSEDINRAWENIKENSKPPVIKNLGLHELKQHKPRFDEECLGFFRSNEADQNAVGTTSIPKQRT